MSIFLSLFWIIDWLSLDACGRSFGRLIILNTSIVSTTRGPRDVISGVRGRRSLDRSTWPSRRSCKREINVADVVGVFEVCWRDEGWLEGTSNSNRLSTTDLHRPFSEQRRRRKLGVALDDWSRYIAVCCGSRRRHGPSDNLCGSLNLHVATASL